MPDGTDQLSLENDPEQSSGASRPPSGTPAFISPDRIRPNLENPRQFFPEKTIQRLADSIDQVGVLVPITVYEDPDGEGSTHVLLDGECRWRASVRINLPEIPAWVVDKPTGVDNALTMFNIHMLREEWTEIATAWALRKLIEELGTDDEKVLREKTGLSATRIRNMKIVLRFPPEYQELIAREDNKVVFNFFVELDKAILSWARKEPSAVANRSAEDLTELFLDRYQTGALGDVVDLRKVGELIRTGRQEGFVGERARSAFQRLLDDPTVPITEAYAEGAAASAEVTSIVRDVRSLPGRISHLLTLPLAESQRRELANELEMLREQLDDFLGQVGE